MRAGTESDKEPDTVGTFVFSLMGDRRLESCWKSDLGVFTAVQYMWSTEYIINGPIACDYCQSLQFNFCTYIWLENLNRELFPAVCSLFRVLCTLGTVFMLLYIKLPRSQWTRSCCRLSFKPNCLIMYNCAGLRPIVCVEGRFWGSFLVINMLDYGKTSRKYFWDA